VWRTDRAFANRPPTARAARSGIQGMGSHRGRSRSGFAPLRVPEPRPNVQRAQTDGPGDGGGAGRVSLGSSTGGAMPRSTRHRGQYRCAGGVDEPRFRTSVYGLSERWRTRSQARSPPRHRSRGWWPARRGRTARSVVATEWALGLSLLLVDTLFSHDRNAQIDALVADIDGSRSRNDLAYLILTLLTKAARNGFRHISEATATAKAASGSVGPSGNAVGHRLWWRPALPYHFATTPVATSPVASRPDIGCPRGEADGRCGSMGLPPRGAGTKIPGPLPGNSYCSSHA